MGVDALFTPGTSTEAIVGWVKDRFAVQPVGSS
jgi:hypothetical protein